MKRTVRILAVVLTMVSLAVIGGTGADADESTELAPRVLVSNPWAKDDTVGDASRPAGDVRRVVITNGRQNVNFFWRMVAAPAWDTTSVNRVTRVAFEIDWRGTTAPHNRRVVVSRHEGVWTSVIFNGIGNAVCVGNNLVRVRSNHRFDINVPVQMCLGGAKVLRVATRFHDDRDDTAGEDVRTDRVPNNGGYGPFIRLPARGRAGETTAGGWTVL